MSNNRKPVTVRLNLEEQANMRSLCEFWGLDPARIMKLAFEQLVTATSQLQSKLKVADEAAPTEVAAPVAEVAS